MALKRVLEDDQLHRFRTWPCERSAWVDLGTCVGVGEANGGVNAPCLCTTCVTMGAHEQKWANLPLCVACVCGGV